MTPGPISPTESFHFRSEPHNLYAEFFGAKSCRGAAVLVHGYAEHCGRYREVAHVLVNAGWSVLAFDLRGHGQSTGKRGHVDRFAEYHDDLAAAFVQCRQRIDASLPRIIVGHSNGALITLSALIDPTRRPDVCAAIVSSPFLGLALRVPPVKVLLGKIASRIAPGLTMPNTLAVEQLTSDPEKQRERIADKLCHEVATARWFTEAIAAQHAVSASPDFGVPTTWLIGGDDPIADAAVSREIAQRARPKATIHVLSGMRHEVFNEQRRDVVFAHMLAALPTDHSASSSTG